MAYRDIWIIIKQSPIWFLEIINGLNKQVFISLFLTSLPAAGLGSPHFHTAILHSKKLLFAYLLLLYIPIPLVRISFPISWVDFFFPIIQFLAQVSSLTPPNSARLLLCCLQSTYHADWIIGFKSVFVFLNSLYYKLHRGKDLDVLSVVHALYMVGRWQIWKEKWNKRYNSPSPTISPRKLFLFRDRGHPICSGPSFLEMKVIDTLMSYK